jgi:hypothetical protein
VIGVKITVPGMPEISTEIRVNVLQDTTPPEILSAGSLDGTTIAVVYNEYVNTAFSGDSFNYFVESQGVQCTIFDAIIWPDEKSVLLHLDPSTPVSETFSVGAFGVFDIANTLMIYL